MPWESWPGLIVIGLRPELLVREVLVPAAAQFPYAREGIELQLLQAHFWTGPNLKEISLSLLLGVCLFALGHRTGLFHWHPPFWCSIHQLGRIALGSLLHGGKACWSWAGQLQQSLSYLEARLTKEIRITLSRLDFRPGQSRLYEEFCIANLNFDVMLIFLSGPGPFPLHTQHYSSRGIIESNSRQIGDATVKHCGAVLFPLPLWILPAYFPGSRITFKVLPLPARSNPSWNLDRGRTLLIRLPRRICPEAIRSRIVIIWGMVESEVP